MISAIKTYFLSSSRNNQPIDKGFSDYIEKGTFYKDGIKLAKKDQLRYQDYGFLGKGSYDALYRKDKAGDEARQKIIQRYVWLFQSRCL